MKYVIALNDGKSTAYFTHIGMWNMPQFVGESRKNEARKFETKQGAINFRNEWLGTSSRYQIVEYI